MKIRRPVFDFSQVKPAWTANLGVAHAFNATSTTLPHLEPYLNKVMVRVRDSVADEPLQADINLFIGQEGNHYRIHRAYNAILYDRYPRLKEFEQQLADDYRHFLSDKSLAFNAAYCEGFESIGIIQTRFFFEQAGAFLPDADPAVRDMWKWHLAEEFEHRSVCFDALRAVSGSYLRRLSGLVTAIRHLQTQNDRVRDYMLSVDFAEMSPAEVAWARAEQERYEAAYKAFARPHLLAILSPRYHPRRKSVPQGAEDFLAEVDASLAA